MRKKIVRGEGARSGKRLRTRKEPRTLGRGVSKQEEVTEDPPLFPIVAVGASAGGLEAFIQLLAEIPSDSGMAFVVIQHLDPSHKSLLGEALSRSTRMPVAQAEDGQRVAPNRVYVIPPEADISIANGSFVLRKRTDADAKPHLPIDVFFNALAAERGNLAMGVVLSGSASDGTEGLRAIKAEGGITFAQAPGTAKFHGMPTSAIDAGVVDYELPLGPLAQELVRLSRHPYLGTSTSLTATPLLGGGGHSKSAARKPTRHGKESATTTRIMAIVKAVVGVDFREYKFPTFERRLSRRIALSRVDGQENYLRLLERQPDEVRALCEDTLIHVSTFFRETEVFEAVKTTVFPAILKHKADGAPIRIWVAGCSTGEEVYSLAISLLEHLGDSPHRHPVQLFGSDVSERAIQSARSGKYSDGAMRGVSEERRRRYFTKVETGFRVSKSVRDMCVFVRHDLARDPPFSKLDLLSCRNVLIYFDQALQKRVLPTFHYCLNQPGFLLLGRTEQLSGFARLFSPVDAESRIFARSSVPTKLRFSPRSEASGLTPSPIVVETPEFPGRPGDIARHLDALMLARYAPPGVLLNEKLEIIQFRGQTGAFLQAAPGEPQNNVIKMARPGLRAKLSATLARVKREMTPVTTENVEVDQDGFTRRCDIVALPFAGLPEFKKQLFIVLFEERPTASGKSARLHTQSKRGGRGGRGEQQRAKDARRIPKLEHQLSATTEYLHSLIQEHSRTYDDLGSANEELVSGNEELQSLNEEMETAKEELQSTNEELTTVNDELHNRNAEVGQINGDLVNLLETVDIPIVIVDKQRAIRRFTSRAGDLLNVLPSDIGRPLDDINPKIIAPKLDTHIAEVIANFAPKESEVQDREGRWYRMQIRPYKTAEGNVDGAVVSLFDIDALKHHLTKAQQAKEAAERADAAKDEFLAVLSHELRTPLAALLMQTQLLRQGGTDAEKHERACAAIERSTRIQVQLIDDLLDVSRIVTGKMRVDLQPMGLVAVVQGTLENVAPIAKSKSVTVRSFLDRTLPAVMGDRSRLEQVICNLLINAIKFTPSGGKIDVVLEKIDGKAHLKVSDTGMGIEPEFLPRIFNRLTQKDSSSTRAHAGLGLGLAIVRHLVEAHGGTVTAESQGADKGATFHVNLPLMLVQPASPSSGVRHQDHSPVAVQAIAGRLSGVRLLVVEDDPDIREALDEMLTHCGAAVITAESCSMALARFGEFHPDVLLCDLAMPVADGYDFIRQVRALGPEARGDVPAIALTALAGELHHHRALSDGFQMLLTKPVDMDRLAEAVASLAISKRAISAASARNDSHPVA